MSVPVRRDQLATTGGSCCRSKEGPQGVSGQRRTVLSEEDYSETLSKVIRRNYFPDLNRLEAQVALQSARQSDDFGKVIATRRAIGRLQQSEDDCLQQERMEEADQNELGLRNKPRPLDHESLTNFHIRVTSEDNATFESNQQEEIKQRNEERLLLTNSGGKKISDRGQKRRHPLAETPLMLASDDFNATPNRPILTKQETKPASQVNNELFFPPSSVTRHHGEDTPPHLLQQNINDSKQVGGLNEVQLSSKSEELALMPPPARNQTQQTPSSVELARRVTAKEMPIGLPVEYIPKDSMEKKICPASTRFPSVVPAPRSMIATSLQDLVGDDRSVTTDDYTSDTSSVFTDLDATPRHSVETELQKARKRKIRENETLVAMTPIIVPGRNSAADGTGNEPLMTWGEVTSSPLALPAHEKGGDGMGPTFIVAGKTSRETAADQALAELQARGRRRRVTCASSTYKSQSSIRGALTHQKKTPTARSSSAFGTALRASYSRLSEPRRRPSSHLREHRAAHAATPDLFQKKRSIP